jgi:hypothetical protein
MRWKISAAFDIIFLSLAAASACALGNTLVAINFSSNLRPHSNVIAHFMFRGLTAPSSLTYAFFSAYWLPFTWWALLATFLGLIIAELILIRFSPSLIYRVAVRAIAKERKVNMDLAYREAEKIPDLAKRFRSILIRQIMLGSLPGRMISLFMLGGVAGGVAWLIAVFVDNFSSGFLQVSFSCLMVIVGGVAYDVIDTIKEQIMGDYDAFNVFSELAEVPAGGQSRKVVDPKVPGRNGTGCVPRGRPQWLLVTSGGLAGTTIGLTGQQITIGRAGDAILIIKDDYVSSRHARLFLHNGQWVIEDLGSTNGTYLDRQKVTQPIAVPTGVPIRIGKTVLELRR